jgi:hypothetical protein
MIKLVAFQAGGGAHMRLRVVEQRTAEYRILNIECRRKEFCRFYPKKDRVQRFRPSSIVNRHSIIQSFFFDQTGRFFGRRLG